MHDLSSDSWIDATTQAQAETPVSQYDTEWPLSASVAAEAPYRVPTRLDFDRLRAVIAAKRSAAEDHIWGLREDPKYYAEAISDWSEHQAENVLDENGKRHHHLNTPFFWDHVIGNAVLDAYKTFITWDAIFRRMTELSSSNKKYSKTISSRQALPSKLEEVLHNFIYFLHKASKDPIDKLKMGFRGSPPLRRLFVREIHAPNSTSWISKLKSDRTKEFEKTYSRYKNLCDEHLRLLSGAHLIDEFERSIQSDHQIKELITSWIAQVFSDLSVIIQTRQQLNMFHPSTTILDTKTDELISNYVAPFSKYQHFQKNLEQISPGLITELGNLSNKKFHYPSHKRRTQQSTKDMQAAEKDLDTFWEAIDRHFSDDVGESLHPAIQHLLTTDRQIQRTPDWTEPSEEPKETAEKESLEEPYIAISTSKDFETRTGRTILPETPSSSKHKIKTHGTTDHTEPSAVAEEPNQRQQHDTQPIFAVSKRASKVFSTLFHSPSQSDTPGEVAWSDFLHAMAATGFAPERLYGSVWLFTPTKLDIERSIQFHEPHPHGKIPFTTARRHGRRLNRAYGWTRDMFTLRII